ncbi:MAG TPA: N-acetyltransferase [Candidatus Hydrogenedentes bacterium]|nr:N-acetyltransferase [Candidatus Hydrogenedentota bacterium]
MLSDDVIYLRKLEREDLEQTYEWFNTPYVYLIMGVESPVSRASQARWFDAMEADPTKIVFALCLQEGHRHVGNVSLDHIDRRHRNARISIFIGEKEFQGIGLGSRAMRLLVQYAFDYLNLHKLWSKARADDEELDRWYERLGFQCEGRQREQEFLEGRYVDKNLWGLLRSDFNAK